jgi:short-subunit dehydrogenase
MLKDSGVTVTCLIPGLLSPSSSSAKVSRTQKSSASEKDDPADVAKFKAMMAGEGEIVTGWKNKIESAIANVTPAEVLAERTRKQYEPGSTSS